jgi:hypothetical protein
LLCSPIWSWTHNPPASTSLVQVLFLNEFSSKELQWKFFQAIQSFIGLEKQYFMYTHSQGWIVSIIGVWIVSSQPSHKAWLQDKQPHPIHHHTVG